MGDSHNTVMAKKLIEDGVEEKAAVMLQEFPDTFSIYLSLHPTFFGSSFCWIHRKKHQTH